jgi:chaperonin cofactor prefoldin
MSLEEEVEMLEKVKERLETNIANLNERLEKLKA